MNDEWSRCPICFEDYSLEHRPTTFVCGHSTCIDHTVGSKRLRYCPICRNQLRENEEYHVSYNLEEASRLFQAIKNTIDWSTVKLPTASVITHEQNSTLQTIHRDEIYARQVQAELNREAVNGSSRRTRVGRENQALPAQQVTTGQAEPVINRHIGHQKTCGHRCELVTTRQCCACEDRRPQLAGYPTYVDGRRRTNGAARNRFYCPTCKRPQ